MTDTRVRGYASAAGQGQLAGACEPDLIARCQGGDLPACDALLTLYHDTVYALVWTMGRDASWVEDTVGEALYQLYRSVGSYRGLSAFKTWVYAVTIRVCRMQLRKLRRRVSFVPLTDDHVPAGDDPAASVLERSRQEEALLAVAELPEIYRLPMTLRYVAECSYQEVADVLNIPVGTAKRRVFEGVRKVRSVLPEASAQEAAS